MEKENKKKTNVKKENDITNKELQDIISKQNEQLKTSVNNYKRLMVLLIILMIISVISQGLYFYAHKDMFDNTDSSSVSVVKETEEEVEEDEALIDYEEYIGTYKVSGYRVNIKDFNKDSIDLTITSISNNEKIASISTSEETINDVVISDKKIEFTFTDDNFGNSGKGTITLEDDEVIDVDVVVDKMNEEATWNISINNIEMKKED